MSQTRPLIRARLKATRPQFLAILTRLLSINIDPEHILPVGPKIHRTELSGRNSVESEGDTWIISTGRNLRTQTGVDRAGEPIYEDHGYHIDLVAGGRNAVRLAELLEDSLQRLSTSRAAMRSRLGMFLDDVTLVYINLEDDENLSSPRRAVRAPIDRPLHIFA